MTALDRKALAETQIEFDHVPPGLIEEIIIAWNRRVSPSQGEGTAADVVEAAKAVIADWDHRLPDGPESFKTNEELGFSYWSPTASMVSSEPMSRLRAALASLAPRAEQEAPADEQSGETSHVADDGQPDEAQEWHDYDPDC